MKAAMSVNISASDLRRGGRTPLLAPGGRRCYRGGQLSAEQVGWRRALPWPGLVQSDVLTAIATHGPMRHQRASGHDRGYGPASHAARLPRQGREVLEGIARPLRVGLAVSLSGPLAPMGIDAHPGLPLWAG